MSALPILATEYQRRITVFSGVNNRQGRLQEMPWEQLPAFLASGKAAEKRQLPCFSTAVFPNNNSAAGAKPISYDYVIGDYDAKEVSIEDAVARLNAANIRALVHTSTSHTPEAPTWHVLCPVSNVSPDEYVGLVERLNSVLNGILQPESERTNQMWFYGSAGNPVEVFVTDGDRDLDTANEILGAPLKPKRVPEAVGEYEPELQTTSVVVEFYSHALEFLPSTDYLDWVSRSYAMASFKGTPYEAQAHAAWCRWTKASPKFQERDLQMWSTLHDAKNKPGLILRIGKEAGWAGSALAAVLDVVKSAPLPLNWQQWLPLLTESERDTMLVAITKRTGLSKTGLNKELQTAVSKLKKADSEAHMRSSAAGRIAFYHDPHRYVDEVDAVIQRVVGEGAPGAIVQVKGRLTHIRQGVADINVDTAVKQPDTWLLMPHAKPTVRRLLTAHGTWWVPSKDGAIPMPIPDCVIEDVLGCATKAIPEIIGISNWPFVTPQGRIVQTFGLDKQTRVFMTCPNTNYRAYSEDEARAAYLRLSEGPLLGEFCFASPLDKVMLVGALLTQASRRILDIAPIYCLNAGQAQSGKTTAVQVVITSITGQRCAVTNYPIKEEETAKLLYALALYGPGAVLMDNVPDSTRVNSATLAAFATSDSAVNRTLGLSKLGESAPTNFMVFLTGNKLTLGTDMLSRTQMINLDVKSGRPSERVYSIHDPISNAIKLRTETLKDICGILGWWATQPKKPIASRFPAWDLLVRQPLLELSGLDIADCFATNVAEDPTTNSRVDFLEELFKWRGESNWKCSELVSALAAPSASTTELIAAAYAAQCSHKLDSDKVANSKSVGMFLQELKDGYYRSVSLESELRLTYGRRRVDGVQGDYYSVTRTPIL